jgi:MutS domain V
MLCPPLRHAEAKLISARRCHPEPGRAFCVPVLCAGEGSAFAFRVPHPSRCLRRMRSCVRVFRSSATLPNHYLSSVIALSVMPPDAVTPSSFYSLRAREIETAADETNRRCSTVQGASLVSVMLLFAVVMAVFVSHKLPPWLIVLPITALAITTQQAQKHRRRVLKLLSNREYYDKGAARLRHEWDSLDDGKDFMDRDHIYASDLDLFGRGSLFQLLCSARTHAGRETLAHWMKKPAGREEVLARQAAVSELRDRHDVRESVASAGSSTVFTLRPRTIRTWVNEISSRRPLPRWLRAAAFAIVVVLAAIPFLYWFGYFGVRDTWFLLGSWLAFELAFASLFIKKVQFIMESADSPSAELPIVADLLETIERESFSSPKLANIASRTKNVPTPASRDVRRLARLVRLLQARNTFIFFSVVLWCTQLAAAIDRWHRLHGAELLEWLDAIGEFEALVSLSAYAFEHPNDIFPELVEAEPTLVAEELGHPLIPEDVCVKNDVCLGADPRFLIVSGSNMSGKSTFLRAIGSNAVLAWMGAPVRCALLQISPVRITAAIRIQDSLADGQSHFFAEMQRLRRMIDLAGEAPLLFLVDEIMSGTNSKDRRIAAEWVMRALIRRGAIGLITTHDLTLTEIAANGLPGSNVYFEDSGEGGQLHFDYKLRSGLLTHSNALNIVRLLGIDTNS